MTFKLGEYVFNAPVQFGQWTPPDQAGLYVILISGDPTKPPSFKFLFIGESGNLSDQNLIKSHPKHSCFIREAFWESHLHIATLATPNWTDKQRRATVHNLIKAYSPVCND